MSGAEGKVKMSDTSKVKEGFVALKISACFLPIFLLAIIIPAHPRIISGCGMVVGSILQRYIPPRNKGKRDLWILLFALVGAVIIALIPMSWV